MTLEERVEEVFGKLKSGRGGFRRSRYRGLARTRVAGYLVATAYNLPRLARLLAGTIAP
jgi:IS5 family transposase